MADAAIEHADWVADWRPQRPRSTQAWADDAVLDEHGRAAVGDDDRRRGAGDVRQRDHDPHLGPRQGHRASTPTWDDDVCRLALDAMHRDLPMADRTPMWEEFKAHAPANFQFDPPFANAVAVAVDAPLIDQLVAWTGRQP